MLPSVRSSLAQSSLVFLTTLGALIVLGFVLAYWTWAWFGPKVEPRAPALAAGVATPLAASAYGLFGHPQRQATVPTGLDIRLLGVMAATRGASGYAVLEVDGKHVVALRRGENIAPGIRLAEVYPDHVVLERHGMMETLTWPKRHLPASPLRR